MGKMTELEIKLSIANLVIWHHERQKETFLGVRYVLESERVNEKIDSLINQLLERKQNE